MGLSANGVSLGLRVVMGALATKSYEQHNTEAAKNQTDFGRVEGGCAEVADDGGDDHRRRRVGNLCSYVI